MAIRITSYNVCYTKLLRLTPSVHGHRFLPAREASGAPREMVVAGGARAKDAAAAAPDGQAGVGRRYPPHPGDGDSRAPAQRRQRPFALRRHREEQLVILAAGQRQLDQPRFLRQGLV